MKQCITCRDSKNEEEFHLHRTGGTRRRGECKVCTAARAQRRREQGAIPHKRPVKVSGVIKQCTRCELELDTSKFDKDRSKSDGLHSHCKSCRVEANREYLLREVS